MSDEPEFDDEPDSKHLFRGMQYRTKENYADFPSRPGNHAEVEGGDDLGSMATGVAVGAGAAMLVNSAGTTPVAPPTMDGGAVADGNDDGGDDGGDGGDD